VSVHFDGTKLAEFAVDPAVIDPHGSTAFLRAVIEVDFLAATVSLTRDDGPGGNDPLVVFSAFAVPGLAPYESRVYFVGRNGALSTTVDIDDILADFFGPPVDDNLLTALGPARVWVGLKNSDAVGLKLDLLAEVFVGGDKIAEGVLDNVSSGSSGFNNAILHAVPLGLVNGTVEVTAPLQLMVSARRTCAGGGHNSGTPRLWYNGQAIDSGPARNAGSRFDATICGSTDNYHLRTGFALSKTAGTSRSFADKFVDSTAVCPDRPYTTFGTWTLTP